MWRKRMQELSRGMSKTHTPLFAPLLFGVAAQIEAIAPEHMRQDGTKIRKNVGELKQALGTQVVFCSAPADEQLAGAGRLDQAGGLEALPGLAASLDAVRQWQADASAPVIAAAFHGPGRVFRWQQEQGMQGEGALHFERIGDVLAAWMRAFAEAGVHLVQWYDEPPEDPSLGDAWKGALGTAGNVARFHRVASVLLLSDSGQPVWPAQAVACPTMAQHPGAMPRPHGRSWAVDPALWPDLPVEGATERLITTEAEVAADTEIAALIRAVQRIRGT